MHAVKYESKSALELTFQIAFKLQDSCEQNKSVPQEDSWNFCGKELLH